MGDSIVDVAVVRRDVLERISELIGRLQNEDYGPDGLASDSAAERVVRARIIVLMGQLKGYGNVVVDLRRELGKVSSQCDEMIAEAEALLSFLPK